MRGLVWGTVVRDIPDNFILELAGHHHQRGRLSPTPKGALAAARTLGRSPSWHAPLPTPPLISLFDGATVPAQVAPGPRGGFGGPRTGLGQRPAASSAAAAAAEALRARSSAILGPLGPL